MSTKEQEDGYIIEREYLSQYGSEELITRIIKSHIDIELKDEQARSRFTSDI